MSNLAAQSRFEPVFADPCLGEFQRFFTSLCVCGLDMAAMISIFLALAARCALRGLPGYFVLKWDSCLCAAISAMLSMQRFVIAKLARRWIRCENVTKSVTRAGANGVSRRLIRRLANGAAGMRVAGGFDDRPEPAYGAARGVPLVGHIDDLLEYAKLNPTELVLVTRPSWPAGPLRQGVKKLRHQPLRIGTMPSEIGRPELSPPRRSGGGRPGVRVVSLFGRLITELALIAKRVAGRVVPAAGDWFANLACLSVSPAFFARRLTPA